MALLISKWGKDNNTGNGEWTLRIQNPTGLFKACFIYFVQPKLNSDS